MENLNILEEKNAFVNREEKINIREPHSCCLIILETCNLKCKMCYMWKNSEVTRNSNQVSLDEWKRFIDGLKDFSREEFQVDFVGGETFLKKGILELIEFCTQRKIRTHVTTNAFLIDEDMAKRIAESGLSSIDLSLDSLQEDIHDFLRGVKGVYRNVLHAIEYLDRANPNLSKGIIAIIMEKNIDELIKMAEWVQKNSKLSHIYFQALMQRHYEDLGTQWYEREEFRNLWPQDINKVYAVLDELIRLKKAGSKIGNLISQLRVYKLYYQNPNVIIGRKCTVGDYAMNVTLDGNVYLCHQKEPIGNIKNLHISPRQMWYSARATQIRQEINRCVKNCETLINCYFEEDALG
jgi:MoaA/NifB/PqqE/SkfB family radical SAM enzyme